MIPPRFSVLLKQIQKEIENTTDPKDLYDLDMHIDDLAGIAIEKLFILEKEQENVFNEVE